MDAVERLSLTAIEEQGLLASEHVLRYALAAEVVRGARVVDLACGVGYGASMLAADGREVTGVDVAPEAIEQARGAFGDVPGLRFEQADAVAFLERLQPDDVDAVVCFEGLEHLPDLEAALGQLERLAAGGTALLLSVPNSRMAEEDNRFHVTQFGYEAARELAARFSGSVLIRQYNAEGSVLVRGEQPTETAAQTVLGERAEPEWANHYLLAVGLGGELDAALPEARMRAGVAPQHNRYVRELERENGELWRTNQRLARGHRGIYDSAAAALLARIDVFRRDAEKAKADLEYMKEQVVVANADAQAARDAAAVAKHEQEIAELRLKGVRNRRAVRIVLGIADSTATFRKK